MAQWLASAGFVAAAIEYRLSPEARYPAAVHDVKSAVRWMRAHAHELRLDSTRIAVLGCSSGGHLAALVGSTNGDPSMEGEEEEHATSSVVQAVIDIDGVLDLTDPAESGKDTVPGALSAAASWLGHTFRDRPDLWRAASPANRVGPSTPPILFINSALERFHAGREAMIRALTRMGIRSRVETLQGTPHPFWLFHPWFEPTCAYVIDFLRTVWTPRE
jgi:pectinesterase